jgi:DNA-binding NarL/FixJ family response regulator
MGVNVQTNMNERENGQLSLATRTSRSRISSERWEQIKVAYVSGIGLREIARKMNIPEGTVLAHAKRHGWTHRFRSQRSGNQMQSA